jgi:uncharacterized protein (DUF58 family)
MHEILEGTTRMRGALDRSARARRRVKAPSGTFAGHRPYEAGEDLRLVDWNAYRAQRRGRREGVRGRGAARAGTRRRSLGEHGRRQTRRARSRRCASRRSSARWPSRASTRCTWRSGRGQVHALQGARSCERLLEHLLAAPVSHDAPLEVAESVLGQGRGGVVWWISDFVPPEAFGRALRLVTRHGRTCLGLLPRLALDEAPREDGWVAFVDPESGRESRIAVDAALRKAMHIELREHDRRVTAEFRSAGCRLVRVAVPAEGDFRLASWWGRAGLPAWI